MAIHCDCFMQLPRTEALQPSSAPAVISHQFFGALSAQARKALGRAKIQLQKPKQTTTELNANISAWWSAALQFFVRAQRTRVAPPMHLVQSSTDG